VLANHVVVLFSLEGFAFFGELLAKRFSDSFIQTFGITVREVFEKVVVFSHKDLMDLLHINL
jgi:hypothetical protein